MLIVWTLTMVFPNWTSQIPILDSKALGIIMVSNYFSFSTSPYKYLNFVKGILACNLHIYGSKKMHNLRLDKKDYTGWEVQVAYNFMLN